MLTKFVKPQYVTAYTKEDWDKLTAEEQHATDENYKIAMAGGKAAPKLAPRKSAATAEAPATTAVSEAQTPELSGIRNWQEDITLASGRTIKAERIRNCIIYQLDIRKDPWYSMRLTRGFVKAKAEKLDEDTPEDVVDYVGKNPLLGLRMVRSENGEWMISIILRRPKNEAERTRLRDKFGVNPQTIPYLAKKDCQKCKGTGEYEMSSYPGDPVYKVLTEAVECPCSYE